MTDRYEIARDFLLQHFTPEELPEVMARVLKAAGQHLWRVTARNRNNDGGGSLVGVATSREIGRSMALRWLMPTIEMIRWDPEVGDQDQYGQHSDYYLIVSRILIELSPIETPPRTSPPRETESAP